MRILLRFLAAIAAIVFVLATLAVVFLRPCATLGLRAGIYKEVLVEERAYERVPELVGESLRLVAETREGAAAEGGELEGPERMFVDTVRQLDAEDWSTLIGGAVPVSIMRAEVERVLDETEQFLHGEGAFTGPVVSLVEVKQRLAGASMTEAYAALLARKPPCTPEQWEASFGLPVLCQPTPDEMAATLERFGELSRTMAQDIPDTVALFEGLGDLGGPEGMIVRMDGARAFVRRAEMLGRWSPVVPAALALFIVLCAVRSFRGLLLWLGVPCLVAGAIGSLFAVIVISIGAGMVHSIATTDLPPETPIAWVEAVMTLSSGVMRALLMPALGASLILALGGFLAVIVAFITRPKPTPPPLMR